MFLYWLLSEFCWAPRSWSYISSPATCRRLERLAQLPLALIAGRYRDHLGIGWRATSLALCVPAGIAPVTERGAMGTAAQKPKVDDATGGPW